MMDEDAIEDLRVPSGWSVRELQDLADPVRGITYGIVQPGHHVPDGVPMIRVQNIGDGTIDTSDLMRVSPNIAADYGRTCLRGGELLLSLVGSVGSAAIAPEEMAGWNTARAIAVIPLLPDYDARWVRFCLQSKPLQHLMDVWCNTTVQATLNLKDVNRLPIPLPSKQERTAMVDVLGALDDKIALNRQMNRTLEEAASALFRSWFVDFDPVVSKVAGRQPAHLSPAQAALFPDSFIDSSLDRIPRGWAVVRLAELTDKIGSGSTPRGGSAVYVEEGPALIRSQNVHDHEFEWSGLARLNAASAHALRSVEVKRGDVLLNITGDSILRSCVVDPDVLPAHVNQHVAIIRTAGGVPSRYIHLYLVQSRLKELMLGFDAGGTRAAITKGQLESVEVLKPQPEVLDAFEQLTDPLFAMVDANRAESRTLVALRDSLLPKLLSGEVRVKDAERLVEARV